MPRRTSPHSQGQTREPSLPGRVPFGLARGPGQRVELMFALRQGGVLAVSHELREAVAAGKDWVDFADSWSDTGQRAYLNLAEVVGFTARPAR